MSFRRLCAVALLCSVGLFADGEEPVAHLSVEEGVFQPFTGQIQGARVRMRTQPTLDGHIVRELNKDDLIVVVGEAHDYFAVQPPKDLKAYVYRTYVLDGEVQGSHVNVRLSPDVESPIIGQLNTGDHIEGRIAEQDPHWLEIDPPEGACFFVAKEYMTEIGGPDMVAIHERRLKEVGHLLNSAYLTSQSEMRKAYPEIDFAKVTSGFERVCEEYSDFPTFVEKAEKVLGMAQELHLQKKVAYLESRAGEGTPETWEETNTNLAAEIEEYARRLKGFEQELAEEGLGAIPEMSEEALAVGAEVLTLEDDLLSVSVPNFGLGFPHLAMDEDMTDRMGDWAPVEQSLYHLWAMENGDRSLSEFYAEQKYRSEVMEGIIEAYNRPVQNRPGDYMLRINGRPVAFLYSTKVNLEELVGQKVQVRVVERPNNHFAFPAYFVMSLD